MTRKLPDTLAISVAVWMWIPGLWEWAITAACLVIDNANSGA